MNVIACIVPDRATVLEAAEQAARQGLHLISDGRDVLISPIVPPGWHKVAVILKPQPIPKEVLQCAA